MDRFDSRTTAVLFMDFQEGIVSRLGDAGAPIVARAAQVLERARAAGVLAAFVRVAFRPGYPEISEQNVSFAAAKQSGAMQLDAPDSQIVPALTPRGDEPVVVKHRVGAFSTTPLETILRARGVRTVVLLGLSTSGVVLSTVRHAADADYRIVVAEDGCGDLDPEVHRVLMQKVFPRQATVTTCDAVCAALG